MKSILIFAGFAGIAAAIAIYFVTEGNKNSGELSPPSKRGFNAMS